MARMSFKYEYDEECRDISGITFDVPEDMTIDEYKVMCVKMAHALGYHENSIKRRLGI